VNKHRLKRFGLLTIDILEAVMEMSSMAIQVFNPREFNKRLKYDDYSPSRTLGQLKRLIKCGYLEPVENNGRQSVVLTKKGQIKLLENKQVMQFDGKWRMLTFDVPEKIRARRDSFRASIKRIGFKQVQKSLWACPYTHADEIKIVIEEHHLQKYVAFLLVEKSDIDIHLKRLFCNEWGELE
jgi:DNA-binding transcriptional regulator PaaX